MLFAFNQTTIYDIIFTIIIIIQSQYQLPSYNQFLF